MLQGLIIANADPSVFWLNNFYLFIYLLLRFAYSGVLLMTAFLKIYPIPKIRNIPIYRLAYSIAMYRNISYRNPCIVIRIVSPDSCQYTALVYIFCLLSYRDSNDFVHVGDFLELHEFRYFCDWIYGLSV